MKSKFNSFFNKCDDCFFNDNVCREEVDGQGCEYFDLAVDKNINNKIEMIRTYIKSLGNHLVGKRLTRKYQNYGHMGVTYDGDISLDHYYLGLINDCLYSIRHKQTAWVFNLDQLAEIFRFEPNVEVTYDEDDGVFYLWK